VGNGQSRAIEFVPLTTHKWKPRLSGARLAIRIRRYLFRFALANIMGDHATLPAHFLSKSEITRSALICVNGPGVRCRYFAR
jgi:hypothetical protein